MNLREIFRERDSLWRKFHPFSGATETAKAAALKRYAELGIEIEKARRQLGIGPQHDG